MRKGIIMAFACAALVFTMPFSVKADEGEQIQGGAKQQYAAQMDNAEQYYEKNVDETRDYFYKFHTSAQDGIHLISLASVVESNSATGTVTVQVMDTYGTVVESATAGGAGAAYRTSISGRALDVLLPVSGLAKNEWYYIRVNANDGDGAKKINITNRISEKFVSFLPAADFKMKNNGKTFDFTWNNIQNANKYDSLKSFDGFQLELFANNTTKVKYLGNGGLRGYSLSTTDGDLLALGFPANSVRFRLGCLQTYHSVFNNDYNVTKCVYSSAVYNTEVVKKSSQSDVSGFKYKITKVRGDGTGTVTVLGFANKNKSTKKVVIGSTVNIKGTNYQITAIGSKAFANSKSITTVEIGPNVTTIGANAFDNCPKLKTITVKATNLKKVGKGAFTRIYNKAKFKSPTKALSKKHKKLIKKRTVTGAKYTVG